MNGTTMHCAMHHMPVLREYIVIIALSLETAKCEGNGSIGVRFDQNDTIHIIVVVAITRAHHPR